MDTKIEPSETSFVTQWVCVCVQPIFIDELRYVLFVCQFFSPNCSQINKKRRRTTAKLFATVEFVSVPQATKADGGSVQFLHLKRTTNHMQFRTTANMLTGRNLIVTAAKRHNHHCYSTSRLLLCGRA